MAVGEMRGEIIRPEDGEDAVGFVAEDLADAADFAGAAAGTFGLGGDRDVDLGGGAGDFGAGFPERFAGFEGDEMGEGFGAFGNDGFEGAGDGDAGVEGG